jgi:hypothetical protein
VQPCATSRQATSQIWYKQELALFIPLRDHSQECRPAIRSSTAHTGPYRAARALVRGRAGFPRMESSPVGPHHSSAFCYRRAPPVPSAPWPEGAEA